MTEVVERPSHRGDRRPLSVLFLTHAAGTPDLGPNLRVYSIGKYLARAGAEVTVVGSGTFHKYRDGSTPKASLHREHRDGMTLIWLRTMPYRHRSPSQILNQLHFPLRVLLSWKRLAIPEPDVVVVSSPPPFIAWVGDRIARRFGVPWVYEMRDLWPLVLQGIGSFSNRNPYIASLKSTESFAVSRAARVVVVKPGDEQYIRREYGSKAAPLTYIPNGIDPENLPDLEQVTNGHERGERIRICYVGALTSYYVLDELVLAFELVRERFRGVELVIAGDGPRLDDLKQLVAERGIEDVIFLGRIGRQEVGRLLASSSIGYVGVRGGAADKHGISTNKLFEYMYAGLPVLACYDTDHDPVLESRCGVTVPEASPEALGDGLAELLSRSDDQRLRMGENGRKHVNEHHFIPRLSERYGTMLRQVVDRTET